MNENVLENVLHIKDVTEVVIGYLANKSQDDTDPAITSLRGVLCLCDRTIKELFNENS